uniref:Hepatocyte growth factor-regulated tyrosine kinase substrate n=1 Tax=Timema douglasi TaxID=61478 RepID=A0A7R8VH62_TIMDO|nr:unnamed protein product [Timema douglasi]
MRIQGFRRFKDMSFLCVLRPKYALAAIKKKLYNANPHIAVFGLQVLESCVKNCGNLIHEEVGTKQYMEQLRDLVRTTNHDNVKNKVLELIQAWAFAFRNSPKYRAVQDTVNIMKTEGFKFPALKESDAMFSADTAPEWADADCCHRCRVAFGVVQRKHHCRACGQVFCAQCSSKTSTVPKFGFEKEVRVCEACYDSVNKSTTTPGPTTAATLKGEGDLPPEYVSSSLAQQNQAPPRKTEEELREEEEFQLALALSQLQRVLPHISWLVVFLQKKRTATMMSSAAASRAKQYSPPPHTQNQENGESDGEIEEFVAALKGQVEIFVNRMKSNSSRGRCIANDSSVQTLFMNITAMHSRLLRYIQQQDDNRVYYEGLQDKLTQVKDARAALDALREEHREKLRRQAEEAERIRQMQMAHKLEIMRKKKQDYLQYQRQLALQRIQEQERERQMRQEQQKQQYLMGTMPSYPMHYLPSVQQQGYPPGTVEGPPVHGQFGPGHMVPGNPYAAANIPGTQMGAYPHYPVAAPPSSTMTTILVSVV